MTHQRSVGSLVAKITPAEEQAITTSNSEKTNRTEKKRKEENMRKSKECPFESASRATSDEAQFAKKAIEIKYQPDH